MIPLRQFIPSGNRRSGEQKAIVPSSRKRQRSDDGSPNEERSAPSSSGSKQKAHVANKKAPLAYEAAPLSDNSDFDRNDAPAEDEQRQRTGKTKKNEAKPTKSGKSKNSNKRSAKVSHDQSSEDEDSQTFAVFKMRTANQEQARKEAERESLKISKSSYTDTARTNGKKHTDINSSQSSGSSRGSFKEQHQNSLITISGMTQSVQLSKRARLQSSLFGHDESLPYHVMQLKSAIVEEDGEDLQDDQELLQSGLGPKKTEENDGNRMIPSFPPKPENGKTLLDLLGSQQRQADAQKKQGHRRERPDGLNTESGPDSSPNEEDDSSQVVNGLKKPENIKINEEDSSDDGDDDDEILRFDTVTGELIRPVNAKNASVNKGISEPGQSEEENDFVPTLADAPKSNPNNAEVVVPISISRFLRRYQRVGVQFFYDRYVGIKVDDIGIVKGGVLGDDMGLGKTIQVLAFLSAVMDKTGTDVDLLESRSRKGRARRREGSYTAFTFGPTCLITCPKTLVNNWTNLEFGVIESKADRDSVIVKYKNGFLDLGK
ncbi:hypothetical protein QFC21_001901 [Naganishia friedmannii]|uniref:Uncharacterized protein n=1 Tax=Naganishia friedmannii TaxID=89922 RepID=A0ACC2W2I9_9TREE|nr:hypothetical protein QFC21_001901 [Naganishia friedmannii]